MQAQHLQTKGSGTIGMHDGCVLFIDDSNIFIEAQKYFARHQKLRVPQDPRCRIDVGKLIDLALRGRSYCHGKLYGSEPPAIDSVWRKIREHLEVETFQKSAKGKEKRVDTAMTTDTIAYVYENKHKTGEQTIIVIAGDGDFCPPVERVLSNGWKVELLAFERSISKEMRKIRNDNFVIITMESLLDMGTCCYVSARWRAELYPIPRNRTIILQFKERLIAGDRNTREERERMQKFANEITLVTCLPCFYHLCKGEPNAGRWVFIVAFTKVYGNEEIDFFRICKEYASELNAKCSEISPAYEKYTTMMESRETDEYLKLENKFSVLSDVKPVAESSLWHIYDDDDDVARAIDDGEKVDVDQTEDAEDESEGEDAGTDGFTEVKSSGKDRKPGPKYSSQCQYEFNCSKGRRCDYSHTPDQVSFFKANNGAGHKGYKSKPCNYHYRNRSCKHGPKDSTPNCGYYHSPIESRCYLCKYSNLPYIGHASHDHSDAP